MPEEAEAYRITEKGYEHIWSWIRLTNQLCELEHGGLEECEDLTHEVAFTLVFVLPTPEAARAAGVFE